MSKFYIMLVALLLSANLAAQSDEDFEMAGKNLYYQLTEPSREEFLPYIRVRQYLELLDNQEWDEEKKTRRKIQTDISYSELYVQWQTSVQNLQKNYRDAQSNGAELSYLGTRVFPGETLSDTYNMETSFIFRTPTVQSEVILTYQAGWLPEIGLRLMSTVQEGF